MSSPIDDAQNLFGWLHHCDFDRRLNTGIDPLRLHPPEIVVSCRCFSLILRRIECPEKFCEHRIRLRNDPE